MPTTIFSQGEVQELASEIKRQLIPVLIEEFKQSELPPLLDRKQFMELAGISPTKCNELFNRADFPVNRELGHPKVPTKEFFNWLQATTQNAQEVDMKFPYQAI
ncbi:hypothetical protein [Lentibacillus amyloliquefaciens]|uniref:Uncharacterized protein n=1 Tax=Lentibacillus amyloliquefaciens TaxID=1472767 RepID=A0A0U4FFP1_9BACI|nr:hypothetical protein [Lentibacillus amyloliquefaciens]ALX47486.1 hypothetical protein AOX59_02035 [Lentibacillus amyloliquefaciens]